MAAISMHKSGGSLTQSSVLLTNRTMNAEYVRQIINLTQTTSASYLLLSSLDISRRNLALRGKLPLPKWWIWRNTPGRRSTPSAVTMPTGKS